jgi:tetratricopeptide (TPR) repeat protein
MGEKLHGANDLGIVGTLLDLAYLEIQRAHSERARPYVERALAIQLPVLGDQHPQVAETIEFLGGVASETEHYAEAADHYRRARAIYERAHGARSTAVASLLGNLAHVELMQGNAADALAHYRTAYEIDLRELGPLHEMTLWQQSGIATALQETGRPAEARTLLLRALDDARRGLGPEHQTIAMMLEALGTIELRLRAYTAARAHFRESLEMYRRVVGADYPGTLSLRGIGQALLGLGQPVAAIEPLEQSRRTMASDNDDLEPARVDSVLGRALIESGRDRARGRQLVQRAWPMLAGSNRAREDAAELAAWMKRHAIAPAR